MAGDILDGYHPKGQADAALQDLIDIFDALQRPHWHMIGNHCLYNLPRKVISPPTTAQYSARVRLSIGSCKEENVVCNNILFLLQNYEASHALQVLNARLRMEGPGGASYYSFTPHAAWRIIVLDGYDVRLLGWPPEHPLHQQAQQILDKHNPNQAWHQIVLYGGLHASRIAFSEYCT